MSSPPQWLCSSWPSHGALSPITIPIVCATTLARLLAGWITLGHSALFHGALLAQLACCYTWLVTRTMKWSRCTRISRNNRQISTTRSQTQHTLHKTQTWEEQIDPLKNNKYASKRFDSCHSHDDVVSWLLPLSLCACVRRTICLCDDAWKGPITLSQSQNRCAHTPHFLVLSIFI